MVEAGDLIKIELFGVFLKKQLEELATVTEKKKYKQKDKIYQQGDRANRLYVIIKGLVSMVEFQPGDKVGIVFEERGRGEIFGCASFMKPRNHTLTAMCVEDSEVLAIETDKLLDLLGIRQRRILRPIQPEGIPTVFLRYSTLDVRYSIFNKPVE